MLSFNYLKTSIVALQILFCNQVISAEFVIKFSHINSQDSPKGLAALHFKALAEKLTKGRVRVNLYPNGELFKDNEEMEALQLNSVQILAPSFSKFSSLGIHDFEVFDLPYLFRNPGDLHRITQGSIGRRLLTKLEGRGLTGLGFWDNGFKNMSANKPLRLAGDMRGLRMRIQPSKVLTTQMNDLGAIPFSLPFYDTYQYFDNGLIDGTETTPSLFRSLGLEQSQQYLTITAHGYLGYVVIANKRFWDSLPVDIRLQLSTAINETTPYANAVAEQQNADALEAIRKSGQTVVIELNRTEKQSWIDALRPVKTQMSSRVGAGLVGDITAVLTEAGAAP